MLNLIQHRRNTVAELSETSADLGVEIDLRWSHNDGIYLAHDPGVKGDSFEYWLERFNHKTLILNVKEDGIETEILELLQKFGVKEYFFLDQPFPTLLRSLKNGTPCAVRISEFEEIPRNLPETPKWLWVDSFTGDWTHLVPYLENLENTDTSICLVSPELQSRPFADEIPIIKSMLKPYRNSSTISVCTKFPEAWNLDE